MKEPFNRFGLNARSFLFALVIHLGLLALLGLNLNWKTDVIRPGVVKPIQARAIPEEAVQQRIAEIDRREQAKLEQEQAAREELEELEQKRQQEEEKLREVEEQRKLEEQKKAEIEEQRKQEEQKKVEAETQRIEEEKKRVAVEKQRKEAEQKKLAEDKKKQEAEKKQAEKKRLAAEKKKKEEAERKRKAEAKKKQEAERKKKAEAEKKRKVEAEKKRREQALQAKIAYEQTGREAENAMDLAVGRIAQAVENNWRRPPDSSQGLVAVVRVKVRQNGDVISAKVVQSSGDPFFDRSAELAVKKASPLPIPSNPKYYEFINEFNFRFSPDGY